METFLIFLGALLIVLPAFDLFREIFQPAGRGTMSVGISRMWWSLLREPARRSSKVASFVGPVIMITIIFSWLATSILGWTLVLLPSVDSNIHFVGTRSAHSFIDALYLSLVTISTLGFGDLVPTATWARILVPFEALFGLGVAGGTISWLLTVHPVLNHRSSLATKIAVLDHAETRTGSALENVSGSHAVVGDLTSHLATVHGDLIHTPVSYYFFAGERRRSLPDQIATLLEIAARCLNSSDELTRLHGAMLADELQRTVRTVARVFLRINPDLPTDDVIVAWRADHAQNRPEQ